MRVKRSPCISLHLKRMGTEEPLRGLWSTPTEEANPMLKHGFQAHGHY